MADLSPGSEVLTPLNRLPVTRSWNWSTWANGDFPHHWPDIRKMGRVFGTLKRRRRHFRFWKRMWRHLRWRTEAEMAPAPFRVPKTLPILLAVHMAITHAMVGNTIGRFTFVFIGACFHGAPLQVRAITSSEPPIICAWDKSSLWLSDIFKKTPKSIIPQKCVGREFCNIDKSGTAFSATRTLPYHCIFHICIKSSIR